MRVNEVATEAADAQGEYDLPLLERIRDLEAQLATAQALLAKAELPCLNCGRMRGKGDRLMTHDFKVYCDYDCAETDGEEWAQK